MMGKSRSALCYSGRSWWTGLWSCRGIWTGCNVNFPPATQHTPPGLDRSTGSGRGQFRHNMSKVPEQLCIWKPHALAATDSNKSHHLFWKTTGTRMHYGNKASWQSTTSQVQWSPSFDSSGLLQQQLQDPTYHMEGGHNAMSDYFSNQLIFRQLFERLIW